MGKHPLHMMLVHFPTALALMDFTTYTLFMLSENEHFWWTSLYSCTGMVATGMLAAGTGFAELIKRSKSFPEAEKTLSRHAIIQMVAIFLFCFILIIQWKSGIPEESWWLTGLKATGFLLIMAGNYFGGELIIRYRIIFEKEEKDAA